MKKLGRWLLICLGLLLLWAAFVSPLSAYAPRSVKQVWQYGHIGLFAIWTYLFLSSSLLKLRSVQLCSLVLIAGLLLGLAIELIQVRVGRELSTEDLLLNLLGCLLGLSLASHQGLLTLTTRIKISLYSLSGLSLLLALSPLPSILLDERDMRESFPVLADFSSPLELKRWKGDVDIVQLDGTQGQVNALKISITTAHYSGVSLAHFQRNWRGFKWLRLEIFNPDKDSLKLTLRIHDDSHYGPGRGDYYDRFNRQLPIAPGWNSISVDLDDVASSPRERSMDMGKIQGFGLFTVDSPRHRHIFISNVRLSGQTGPDQGLLQQK